MNYRYGNLALLKFNLQQLREVREHKAYTNKVNEWKLHNWYAADPDDGPMEIHKWDAMYGETKIQ